MRKVYSILAVLSDEDVSWLARTGRLVRPGVGERIIEQGRAARDLFFVLEGAVTVTIDGIGQIALLQQGEIVGEMSFVDDGLPSATIGCLDGATLLAIDRRDMGDRLAADAGFAARFYRAMAMFLSDRLRIANGGAMNDADELSEAALQTLSNAGQRFDTLRRLALEREGAS